MELKTNKTITNNTDEKQPNGLQTFCDTITNVARHLPLANFAKVGSDVYNIEIDLPGVDKKDIELKVEDDYLSVNAIRKFKDGLSEDDYYLCESNYGLISRTFLLDDNIDRDNIKAKYEDGRLYLTFEKVEYKKARTINIK